MCRLRCVKCCVDHVFIGFMATFEIYFSIKISYIRVSYLSQTRAYINKLCTTFLKRFANLFETLFQIAKV